jgi:replicative DNA helicase Mcm
VVPECGEALERARGTLRLHQSECGLDSDATYCNFENGDANPSIRLAERILSRFDDRLDRIEADLEVLASGTPWEELQAIRERYHVSQRELAADLPITQGHLSSTWGEGTELRDQIRRRLRDVLDEASSVDLDPLRRLVRGDVKWRRVESVREVSSDASDDRIPVLRRRIADELQISDPADAESRARELAASDPDPETWRNLQEELDRYEISFREVGDRMDVDGSTVSRWFSGTVRTGNFPAVRSACRSLIERRRRRLEELLGRIDARSGTKVYDLTVEGTHNFVANGMIVHNSEDRSAMHEGLEQQEISISKAGITATLKSRCSLLGAANPKYGRFDEYEPIAEQIELDPALISRFDLIFTVTDQPDEEEDRRLAEHIIQSNYAGELSTQHEKLASPNVSMEEATEAARDVEPTIDAELLQKYVAYAKRDVFPTMTEAARERIREFYVEMRSKGTGEDAPVPITARKLEALVRLGEASARVRLSDTVKEEDAERVIDIVQSSLRDVGMDPETGEFDADIIETEMSKSQRDRVKNIKQVIRELQEEYDEGAPREKVLERAEEIGMEADKAEHEIQKLRDSGEVYSPQGDTLRVV